MKKTKIEWCDSTINPVIGCKNGCSYCYAKKLNDRFKFVKSFAEPQFFPERLKQLESKKQKNIFMDSMSDVCWWSQSWFNKVIAVIEENPQHNYLFLTKRPDLLNKLIICNPINSIEYANVYWGLTVTKQEDLAKIRFGIKFLSVEPILEKIEINVFDDISIIQIIIGAETGNRKGKIIPKKEWIDSLCKQADEFGIKVFMKDSLIPIVGEKNMRRELIWRSK